MGEEYYYSLVRKNIRKFRNEKGLTQIELAELADTSNEYLSEIENEKKNKHFTIATVSRIAEALDVKIADLFDEEIMKK